MFIVLKFAHVDPVLKHKRLDVSRYAKDGLSFYLFKRSVRKLNFNLVVKVNLKLWPASLSIQTVAFLN